jgi:hypothetical protein
MVGFTMDGGSLRLTIASMNAIGISVRDAATRALGKAAKVLHEESLKNISLDDHTLKKLRQLGHPYARAGYGAHLLNHEFNQVHTHTGTLRRALKVELLPSARPPGEAWVVWFDVDAAPHAVFVVQGTPLMLPRDVLWWTATDPRVQKLMMKAVVGILGRELRTQGVLRFGAGGNPKTPAGSPAAVPGNLAV